ncbi:bifunctional DNA-formamidopyrimidine glycosylase/DNA-(apurinic or apyrimidinic site) lyase [Patescibacteria group bacterium]|nr:bifunctional DNA-formamidopyrimidine glycosylase/DNA-(apurinic or apyrimidinic site) lyase [Patescibacteria group bacterium]
MPELPEVETVRRQLADKLEGSRIVAVELWRSGRETPLGDAFIKQLTGVRIVSIKRRAKLLIWELEDGRSLLVHLKMTGRFSYVSASYQAEKHDRVRFTYREPGSLKKNAFLVWSDMRQFGYLKLVSADEAAKVISEYGIEPLEASLEELVQVLALRTTRAIKTVLLDQGVIAGIGNIYADEACFRAKIHPTREAKTLRPKERRALAVEIQSVLNASLERKGTSAHSYVDTVGERGAFVELLQVYGRKGEPCIRCKTPLQKISFRGRGTHFCEKCQPLKRSN